MKSKLLPLFVLTVTITIAYLESPLLFTVWLWVFPTLPLGVARLAHQYGSSHWIAIASVTLAWYIFSDKLTRKSNRAWVWFLVWSCTSLLFIQIAFLCLLLYDSRTWMTTDFQPFSSDTQAFISKTYALPWNVLFGTLGFWMRLGNQNALQLEFDISGGHTNTLGVQVEQWLLSLAWLLLFAVLTRVCVKLSTKPILARSNTQHKKLLSKAQNAWVVLLFLAYYFSKSDDSFINLSYTTNTVVNLLQSILILIMLSSFGSWLVVAFIKLITKTVQNT